MRNTINANERAHLESRGIFLPGASIVLDDNDPWAQRFDIAMDAQPALLTTPSAGIPAFLTTFIDPDVLRIVTSRNAAATIFGEEKKGSWTDVTIMFPIVEQTGEVSSYGDFNYNGRAGINTSFPQREQYLYQVILEWGDLELERAGLAKIGWAAELRAAGVAVLEKFHNLLSFFGVAGLQNYGLLNDPSLAAPIAPAPKAAGGVKWWNGNVLNATANEIYSDIVSLFAQLVTQSAGAIDSKTPMVLALSPKAAAALAATNQFGLNVGALIKLNYPNMRIETAVQYGVLNSQNPQGILAGEVVQLIAESVDGQKIGFTAFSDKLRTFPVFRDLSSFKQKMAQGSWGSIIRMPFGIAQMLGV